MTFNKSELLSMEYWIPDGLSWLEASNKKRASRKECWKTIQKILKEFFKNESIPSGAVKLHKQLFFKGELPEEYLEEMSRYSRRYADENFFYNFFYFYLWYHPELTEEIIDSVIGIYLANSDNDIDTLRNLWMLHRQMCDLCGLVPDTGMMNGNESLITIKVLFYKDAEGITLLEYLSSPFIFNMMTRSAWFLKGQNEEGFYTGNPCDVIIDYWPEASKAATKYSIKRNEPINIDSILPVFKNPITFILAPKSDLPKWIIEKCGMVKNQWINGEFDPWLNQLFERTEKMLKEQY